MPDNTTHSTAIPLKDLKKLYSREKSPKSYRKSLTGIEYPKDHVALLIVPCLFNAKEIEESASHTAEYYSAFVENKLNQENESFTDPENYAKIVRQLGTLLDGIPSEINRYFVCQNYDYGEEELAFVENLYHTYELLKESETFPYRYMNAIPKLWYVNSTEGEVELITPRKDFLDICRDRDAKMNVLFFHPHHIPWLKKFFENNEKQVMHILPGVNLFFFKE